MNQKLLRAAIAAVLALSAGGAGYTFGAGRVETQAAAVQIPAQTVTAPPAGSVRVIYSLDKKQNDQEIIALINDAEQYIYFAIYTFTLDSIADALVSAKKRGVDVKGVVDAEQSSGSYGRPIVAKLKAAGIPVVAERHSTGNGIMHLKTLVTERAYATGSYNWTKSATNLNDEVLEIGTDTALREAYEKILKRLFEAYRGNSAAAGAAAPVYGEPGRTISIEEAPAHVGEHASVRGTLVNVHTSKGGTVFLDFCKRYKTCPFAGVIFADDAQKFGGLSRYEGKSITLSGKIASYQGKAEIILSHPSQLAK